MTDPVSMAGSTDSVHTVILHSLLSANQRFSHFMELGIQAWPAQATDAKTLTPWQDLLWLQG